MNTYYNSIINTQSDYDRFLLNYLNRQINNNGYLCNNTLNLIDFVKDKDIFLEKYMFPFTCRLISNPKRDIHYQDYRIMDKLNEYDIMEYSKITKILLDNKKSAEINNEIRETYLTYKTNLTYASTGIWPIMHINNTINTNSAFTPQKQMIETYIKNKHSHRTLTWNKDYITGIMTYNNDDDDDDDDDDKQTYYQLKTIKSNKCFKCGRTGHYSDSCYANKHVKGYYLE
jgi:hypothetical protein